MTKLVYVVALLALAGAALATKNPTPDSTHVMVRMELDNTEKQVNNSMTTLKKNIAKELCSVPVTDVQILKVMNDDKKLLGVGDTQTLVYAACKAPTNKLEAVLDDCQDWWNRNQVKDETKDKTSWWTGGEVKVDDIDCRYVEKGKFEYFSKTDAGKAGAALPTGAAATTADAAATAKSSAAGAVPAAVAAIAVAGGAVMLML